ncbi:MAG: alpha/beta hydrolase [Xylanivirga thermophila]|jgi:alpha-beta hydrolase superfamily lysophospholipase|uniref:alpha/beta hydrolase n=1 Tax=Xylanivirga thermophila TaxID=2496273 RepID=UPI00101C828E|nr:alpha/beta hydrolase [Xylanivirga thermophila]
MYKETFNFKASDGLDIFVYKWSPDGDRQGKAVVQIAHGMAETAGRYESFAKSLTDDGYIVYANDHRGHGKTAKSLDEVGYIGPDGFNRMVLDMKELTKFIRNVENPNFPLFLFGHSMGSFLSQRYISLYGKDIQGVILSGTSCNPGPIVNIGIRMAQKEMDKNGPKAKSPRLNDMSFGGYNKKFSPNRTDFDWLSRDENEVDKYIKDPYCGGIFTTSFYYDFLSGMKEIFKKENMGNVPKDLPIYIFGGDKDPVGKMGKGVPKLVKAYKGLGIKDVSYKLYKDGRHEMLNEINRDEVVRDILVWLASHMEKVCN